MWSGVSGRAGLGVFTLLAGNTPLGLRWLQHVLGMLLIIVIAVA